MLALKYFFSKKIMIFIFLYILMTNNNYIQCKLSRQDITVAYALNDGYKYPTFMSVFTLLENASDTTFYTVYLLFEPKSFLEKTAEMFLKLQKRFIKSKIMIIKMDESNFKSARIDRYPMPAYYRLALASLLPEEINRVIYLDGDTMILGDLTEMINLRMDNNIMLGFVDNSFKKAEVFGIKTYKYVTSGVLLLNLRKIRNENLTEKFFNFMDLNADKLSQEDQTVLNIVLHGRVELLPPKYGIWNFGNLDMLKSHNNYGDKNLKIKAYNEKEIIEAWKNPIIAHFVRGKPWGRKSRYAEPSLREKWWEYVKKTDEYKNILKYSASQSAK